MAGFTGLRDMFDGGGAGKSGPRFEGGGVLSEVANRVARPVGYADRERSAGREPTSYFRDAFNGGGMGASGETFQGAGGYSGILNMLGVRPAGYEARGQQMLQNALANTYNTMRAAQRPPQAASPLAPMSAPRPVGRAPVSVPVTTQMQPPSAVLYQGQPQIGFGGFQPTPRPVDMRSYGEPLNSIGREINTLGFMRGIYG